MSGMENLIRRPIHKNVRRCAFTGYRPAKLPFGYDEECPLALDFRKRLHETIEILILRGYRHFISGGAQGMDIMAAETVLDCKSDIPMLHWKWRFPLKGKQAAGRRATAPAGSGASKARMWLRCCRMNTQKAACLPEIAIW